MGKGVSLLGAFKVRTGTGVPVPVTDAGTQYLYQMLVLSTGGPSRSIRSFLDLPNSAVIKICVPMFSRSVSKSINTQP